MNRKTLKLNLSFKSMEKLRIAVFIILALSMANATVIINSNDGRDVVSGTYYASVMGDNALFVVDGMSIEMVASKLKPQESENLIIIEGKNPVMPELKTLIELRGYKVNRIIKSNDPYETNLNLGKELKDEVNGYVIVSPSIGYNAVSPLAYAKVKKYYLIFWNEERGEEIKNLIKDKEALVYGYVPESIDNAEVIDNGDKYLDNIEIVKRTLALTGTKQVLLSDGNFLEYTIMNSEYPVLFISTIVPKSIKDFLKEEVKKGNIKVGLVIGEEYINTAYNLKTEINNELGDKKLSVFVKLGESYPGVSSSVFPSPLFVLPSPYASITVKEVNYNKATGKLEIILTNKGNTKGYFTYSVEIAGNNVSLYKFTGEGIEELKPGEEFLIEKDLNISKDFEGELFASIRIIYGTSKNILDQGANIKEKIATISFEDKSVIEIEEAVYSKPGRLLTIKINSKGDKAFYRVTISYKEGEDFVDIVDDKVRSIEANKKEVLRYDNLDINSDSIKVKIEYGAKEYKMKKVVEKEVKIEDNNYYILVGGIILVLVVVVVFYRIIKKD